jgi:pimeloyl-ACP methyl ester carboxylesterase
MGFGVGILSSSSAGYGLTNAVTLPIKTVCAKYTHTYVPYAMRSRSGYRNETSTLKCSNRASLTRTESLCSKPRNSMIMCSAVADSGFHTLPDGMKMEKVVYTPETPAPGKPPLLFIHGSYHGAWCWEELFMPYFVGKGYTAAAVSLRGQGKSDRGDLKIAGTLDSHVADLASVIGEFDRPPIVVAHSFGGLLLQAYTSLPGATSRPKISGVCLLASVPPSGNQDIIVRITKKSFMKSMRITWGFITKSFAKSPEACRELFFSNDLPKSTLDMYQKKLAECSPVALLDVRTLSKELPLPPVDEGIFAGEQKAFVGGGLEDCVVDAPAIDEAAAYYNVKAVKWPNMAHDVMLDTRWEQVAQDVAAWLENETF